jgi:hypothetical protein
LSKAKPTFSPEDRTTRWNVNAKSKKVVEQPMSDTIKPPRISRLSTRTLILLTATGAIAFVLLVYAITNAVGPEFSTNVPSVTRPAAP